LEKENSFFREHQDCPTCSQVITDEFKEKVVGENEKHIGFIDCELKAIGNKISKIQKLNEDATEIKEAAERILEANYHIVRSIEVKKREISMLQDSITSISELKEESTDDFDEVNENLRRLNNQIDDEKRIQATENSLLRFLKDDGFKATFINQYVEMINEYVNKFLYEMDFMCQFTLDSEFNEVIKSRYRDDFSYSSFSEGEKLRITLAVLFTWRELARKRNSINTNLLLFDEILDSALDAEGVDSFLKIIKHLTKGTNTFIISHNSNSTENSLIDRVLKFEKIKGFSHLSTENK
jgi:DNA repair exonuclease SbcCD ATPase subunit